MLKLSNSELKMGFSKMHQSSIVTLENGLNITPTAIREWLTSSVLDSHVSPSQSPEKVRESWTRAICGPIPLRSYAEYDPNSACWRTYQGCLLTNTLEPYSGSYPKAGIMLDGKLYQRPKWERRINEIGSGLWETPNASEEIAERYTLKTSYKHHKEGRQAQDSKQNGLRPHSPAKMLISEVLLHGGTATRRTWATPTQRDYRSPGTPERLARAQQESTRGQPLTEHVGGQLNPDWVEWLMGWHIGWTDLKPLAMDKYQSWLQQHGES